MIAVQLQSSGSYEINMLSPSSPTLRLNQLSYLPTPGQNICLLLVYTLATVVQLHHGDNMMYELRKRKPEPALLPIEGLFNLPHHNGMVYVINIVCGE